MNQKSSTRSAPEKAAWKCIYDTDDLKKLIQICTEHPEVLQSRYHGETMLYSLARSPEDKEYFSTILKLLELGADINALSASGATPMGLLKHIDRCNPSAGSRELLRIFAEKGARETELETLFLSLTQYCADAEYRQRFEPEIETWAEKENVPPFFSMLEAFSDKTAVFDPALVRGTIATVVCWCKDEAVGTSLIRLFARLGCPVDQKDDRGRTALHDANFDAAEFKPQLLVYARLLVELGADVNALDKEQWTPLHLAAAQSISQVKFLVEHGADPLLKNSEGLQPLKYTSWSSFDAAKNRNFLKKAMGVTPAKPEKVKFKVKILNEKAYREITEASYAPGGISEKALRVEFELLLDALEEELAKQPGNYRIGDEFQNNFFSCGGIYSNDAATPEYVSAVLRAIDRMPHAKNWYYHTVCELDEDEDEPVIVVGEFLIHDGTVYAPDDGNDYARYLSPNKKG